MKFSKCLLSYLTVITCLIKNCISYIRILRKDRFITVSSRLYPQIEPKLSLFFFLRMNYEIGFTKK